MRRILLTVLVSTSLAIFLATATEARFLQTDPVGYQADPDMYTYVGNDPTDRTDPSGNEPEWATTYAAEQNALHDCADVDCYVGHMNSFYAKEAHVASMQVDALGWYAAIASGGEGAIALRGLYAGVREFIFRQTTSAAFKEAFAGGRYAGSLRQMASRSTAEIRKAAASYDRQVAAHADKIAHPEQAVADWGKMSAQEQRGLLQKWQHDMQRNGNLRDVMNDLARMKERATCTGSRIPGNCP